MPRRQRASLALTVVILAMGAPSGGHAQRVEESRPFRMGFSVFPPRPDMEVAVQSLRMWSSRADAAVLHVAPPWPLLLADGDVDGHLRSEYGELLRFYRSQQMRVYLTLDPTDGLARDREARDLRLAGRSIGEPEVQRRFLEFAIRLAALIRPDVMCLAAETNLIRLAAPRPVYDALRALVNSAATEVRRVLPTTDLCITVQAEAAWGRLLRDTTWIGIDDDLRDFPFATALGVSAYPYLAGFATPEAIPLDYIARLRGDKSFPVFVSEGGWSSAPTRGRTSTPELQARYVKHWARVMSQAQATAWLQLHFADLDATAYGFPGEYARTISYFLHTGLVDVHLRPKPALAAWDTVFQRPRRE